MRRASAEAQAGDHLARLETPSECSGDSGNVDRRRGIGQDYIVARHLFIVSRQQPELYSYLSREFSAETEVTVIVDRRQRERRAGVNGEGASENRRQSDRRHQAELDGQLSTLGYAFVRLA